MRAAVRLSMGVLSCGVLSWGVLSWGILSRPAGLWAADAGKKGESGWTQFRGPERTGRAPGEAWPEDFAGLERLWFVPLDKGYPGPLVAGEMVFVAETEKESTEVVRALERKSGKELWRASWPGKHSVPFFAKKSGDWIRATPAFDGKTLYVAGMEEVLVALDGKSGKERWRVNFPARFGTPRPDFGFASSPLLEGEALYVQAANSVIKLNKNTGETIWRSLAKQADIMESGAFSSPVLATLGGRQQLLVQSRTDLFGLDPKTGETLWSQSVPHYRGMNILMPTVSGETVFTSSYRMDSFAYQIQKGANGQWSSTQRWVNKAKGYMSTPILYEGHAYLHLANQRFTCIDLATGETKWTTEPFGQYWSMVLRGDKILALDERGELLLVKPTPERFVLLDKREVTNSPAWAHVAVSGEEIFVRELQGIAAYRWRAVRKP